MTYAMWDTISAKQMEFMRRREKYIAYGGARGGGKSWVARTKAVGMCLRYAGLRVLMVRKTFAQLRENIVLPMQEQFAPLYRAGAMRYNGQNNEVRFYNGSRIVFGYCDSDRDLLQYQGVEYDVIFLEEATQLSEYQFGIIRASLRGTNDYPKRMYLTCNPGGQGHAWVKRLFVDRQFTKDEDPAEYAFIQAKVYDNAVLMEKDPGYLRNLQTLPDGMRKAWLDGSWDVFEGQVFTEWRDDPEHYADGKWTHVIDEFRVPEWWKIWRGFDFGYAKPFSVGWYAADGDGKIYRMSSVKKSIEPAESAQAAGAGTGEDAVREAQREAMAPARVAEEGDPNMTEKVTMRLPVNRENPGDNEVVVGLNGRFYKIRRGVTVEVPRAVALILQQSEEQDAATLEMIEAIRDGKQHQG